MESNGSWPAPDRARIGWWLYVFVLGAAAAFIAHSFIGMISLGVFGYYATRPINRRVETVVDSEGVAAWVTVLLMLVPLVAVLFYAGFQLFTQAREALGGSAEFLPFDDLLEMLSDGQAEAMTSAIEDPRQFLSNPDQVLQTALEVGLAATSALFGALLLVGLALTLSYFLLENDRELGAGLRQLFGGRDTTAYAYASAVDEDLESVFFGNFLFVLLMAAVATVTYWLTNLLAPGELQVPMIFVLGFLTGIASLVPIVVGKIVYLPVVGYLAVQAMGGDGNQFAFVGGVLVVYFLVLDILPQTFLQPYVTGRQLDVVVLMFAYLLGPVLFGWYGFFFLPIVFVLILEAVRIVLPQLIHGEAVTSAVEMGDSVGTTPRTEREEVPDGRENESDGEPAGSGE